MSKNPLLSICIPTYNRSKYLKECLDSIFSQSGYSDDTIDIIISDNASQDDTYDLVQSYQRNFSNIQYFRNARNIGADRNVLKALELGTGKYIWGITDDDIILPGGLEKVISTIKANLDENISFYQVNFNSLDKDGNLLKRAYLGSTLPTKLFPNIHELYKSYNYIHNGLTYYSINIFNSEILSLDLSKTIPVVNFPHSCIMGLISHKKAMFIGESIIGYRTNNNSENFGSIQYFFYVFVICHFRYMTFLRKHNSLVSQWKLTIILFKMIVYSTFLLIKKYTLKMYSFLH